LKFHFLSRFAPWREACPPFGGGFPCKSQFLDDVLLVLTEIELDKMNLPNSKKLFIDSSSPILNEVKSEGEKISLVCKARTQCPSLYCHCFSKPDFCRSVLSDYEDEIRECIKKAFGDE
jgi:hypothetical protein